MATTTTPPISRERSTEPNVAPYDRAVQGFKNYWYPICGSSEVKSRRRPLHRKILGEDIALMRRQGKIYAITNWCPHRGAPFHLGRNYFPDTPTITCRFHGWTFDVTNGRCVAALTDGPKSDVIGKVAVRTYPAEEHNGVVWVWMGRVAPVPIETDVPALLIRKDTKVRLRYGVYYGNWRYHAENGTAGHFATLHHDSIVRMFQKWSAWREPGDSVWHQEGEDSPALVEMSGKRHAKDDYPGLGRWPATRPWRIWPQKPPRPLQGVMAADGIRLPGVLRIRDFPMLGSMYYEWYIAFDEDHYVYFQMSCHWPSHFISELWTKLWYNLWGKPMRKARFNAQDLEMVRWLTDYEKTVGYNKPSPLSEQDGFGLAFIRMANRWARGEGSESDGITGHPPEGETYPLGDHGVVTADATETTG